MAGSPSPLSSHSFSASSAIRPPDLQNHRFATVLGDGLVRLANLRVATAGCADALPTGLISPVHG